MDYRSGKPAKLYTDASVSGSWTNLDEKDSTDSQPGMKINGILWASGSYTTDKDASGSYGAIREDFPAFREPGTVGPSGRDGSGYYVSPVSGSYLHLRDADNDIFFKTVSTRVSPVEGGAVYTSLSENLVVQLPVSYWCSNAGGGCMIRIWGQYV